MRATNACLTTHQPAPVLLHHSNSSTANNSPLNTPLKPASNSSHNNSNPHPPHQPQSPTPTSVSAPKMSPPSANTNNSPTPPRAPAPAVKPPRKAACCSTPAA